MNALTVENIKEMVSFVADTTTAILGTIAILALIFQRDKIKAFAKLLSHTMVNERLKKIKGALARLDSLNYENKEDKREVVALFGEIAGMLKGFARADSEYQTSYNDFVSIADGTKLSESRKRRLAQELHCLLDDHALEAAITLQQK